MTTTNTQALALKAKLLRGFSDVSRLSILEVLREGPRTVSELVSATQLSQPNVSNHLSCLRDCNLVTAQQQGRYTQYQLADPRIAELLGQIDELLADIAFNIYQCTNYPAPQER